MSTKDTERLDRLDLRRDADARPTERADTGRRRCPAWDDSGKTALIWAADTGEVESARILLHAGAKVNATAYDGASAIKRARANNHPNVVALLKSAGAKE